MADGESGGVDYARRAADTLGFSRWWQILAAAGMMAAVSPYQYVWSSIEQPLAANLDIALPALGAVFSFYVVFQSLSQFPAGKWRDRHGPGALTFLAAVLAGGGYVGLAYATAVWAMTLGGTGWLLVSAFGTRHMETVRTKISNGNEKLLPIVSAAAMLGAFAYFLTGEATAGTPETGSIAVGGLTMLGLLHLADSRDIQWLKEWALGTAMLVGLVAGVAIQVTVGSWW